MNKNCITWKKVIQKLSELKGSWWKDNIFPSDDRPIAGKIKGQLTLILNQGPIQRVVYRFSIRFHPSDAKIKHLKFSPILSQCLQSEQGCSLLKVRIQAAIH